MDIPFSFNSFIFHINPQICSHREEKGWGRQDQREIQRPYPRHLREEWDFQVARYWQDQVSAPLCYTTSESRGGEQGASLFSQFFHYHLFQHPDLLFLFPDTWSLTTSRPTTSTTSSERESSCPRPARCTSSWTADTCSRETPSWARSTSRGRMPMASSTSPTPMRPPSELSSEQWRAQRSLHFYRMMEIWKQCENEMECRETTRWAEALWQHAQTDPQTDDGPITRWGDCCLLASETRVLNSCNGILRWTGRASQGPFLTLGRELWTSKLMLDAGDNGTSYAIPLSRRRVFLAHLFHYCWL